MRELTAAQADDLYDYADSAIMPTRSLVPGVLPGQSRRGPGRYSA